MRLFSFQQTVDVPISTANNPATAIALPAGFKGYVRVRFKGAAGGDFMYGKWLLATSENIPQGQQSLTTTNYGLLWADTNEKFWENPQDGLCLCVIGSAANGVAIVDAAGYVEEK